MSENREAEEVIKEAFDAVSTMFSENPTLHLAILGLEPTKRIHFFIRAGDEDIATSSLTFEEFEASAAKILQEIRGFRARP